MGCTFSVRVVQSWRIDLRGQKRSGRLSYSKVNTACRMPQLFDILLPSTPRQCSPPVIHHTCTQPFPTCSCILMVSSIAVGAKLSQSESKETRALVCHLCVLARPIQTTIVTQMRRPSREVWRSSRVGRRGWRPRRFTCGGIEQIWDGYARGRRRRRLATKGPQKWRRAKSFLSVDPPIPSPVVSRIMPALVPAETPHVAKCVRASVALIAIAVLVFRGRQLASTWAQNWRRAERFLLCYFSRFFSYPPVDIPIVSPLMPAFVHAEPPLLAKRVAASVAFEFMALLSFRSRCSRIRWRQFVGSDQRRRRVARWSW